MIGLQTEGVWVLLHLELIPGGKLGTSSTLQFQHRVRVVGQQDLMLLPMHSKSKRTPSGAAFEPTINICPPKF